MGVIRRFFFLLLITVSGYLNAQTDTSAIFDYNGSPVKYYLVSKGKTLYAISRATGVSQDSILLFNPEAKAGLKTGMYLRIPVKTKNRVLTHTVKPKETLYGISRQYGITVDQLRAANPDLTGELKVGTTLVIPSPASQAAPVIAEEESHTEPLENIRENKRCREISDKDRIQPFKIVFLLPFYSSEAEISQRSRIALDFYCGAKLALDSLASLGYRFEVSMFDTESDSTQVNTVLKKKEVAEADLIIGPLYSSAFKPVAEFARKQGIFAISPFSQSDAIIEGFPNVGKVTPDQNTLLEAMASDISNSNPKAELILLKNGNEKDRGIAASIRKAITSTRKTGYTELTWKGVSSLLDSLSSSRENIIFFPSTQPVQVIDLTSKLSASRQGKHITLVGLNEWNSYENIDYEHLNNLNFTYATAVFNQNETPAGRKFKETFKDEYKAEPGNFAYQGFDVAWFFGEMLWKYGRNFGDCLEKSPLRCGLNSCYQFSRGKKENGFENTFVNILQLKDFEPVRINTGNN